MSKKEHIAMQKQSINTYKAIIKQAKSKIKDCEHNIKLFKNK